MNLKQFVAELAKQGVKLWTEGEQLRVRAAKGVITPDLRDELALHKAELIKLLQKKSNASDTDIPQVPVSLRKNLPVSFAQEGIWFLSQLELTNPFYNEALALRLHGSLNVVALEKSLNKVIERHEVLRTNFATVEGQPVQVIAESLTLRVQVLDLGELPEREREIAWGRTAMAQVHQPFDLSSSALLEASVLKLTQTEHVLLLTIHHMVWDAPSEGVLVRELAAFYTAYCNDLQRELPELPIQYADFAVWQRQRLQGDVLLSQLAYWKQQLEGAPAFLELPTDRVRPLTQTFRGACYREALSHELTEALMLLSQRQEVTLFMTLLAALQTLLYRYTGQSDICVGTPYASRERAEFNGLIGLFVNTLVLRTDISGNPSFEELLLRVREVALGAYAHTDLPFEKLVEQLQPARNLSYTPLCQVMLVLYPAMSQIDMEGLKVSRVAVETATAKFDLSLAFENTDKGLIGNWEYNTDLFDASTVARMARHFQTILAGIVANPQQKVFSLPLLTERERHQLLVEWNNTTKEYPNDKCIHQLFEEQVERSPDAIAVVFEDKQLTYRELNQRANKTAHYLKTLGVGPEVLVGMCVERSPLMIVGVLAILKAGGAYVPIDPAYPSERKAFTLEDSCVTVLLTQAPLVESFPQHQARVVYLDVEWSEISQHSEKNPNSKVTPDNLAYVIYTSGSTGKPKGVLLAHRGLCNLAEAQMQLFEVQPNSRVLQFASFSFDASVWEIFMALVAGATLVLSTQEALMPGPDLIGLLRSQAIATVTLPPSALSVLPVEELPALQTIIVAGETTSSNLVASWAPGRRFFNAYGPTESTVCATIALCSDGSQKPPIGRPIANTEIYVLDAQLQPVPIGVPGELYIGGASLARGYLNRPELTQERFVPHPFSSKSGDRLYKSGDRARYLADGNIEFLGRIDHQVKIRGFRIELGEIEAVLNQHPVVQQAVVIVREDSPGHQQLVAYYTQQTEESGKTTIAPPNSQIQRQLQSQLRAHLQESLPEYMVPSALVMLSHLPLTPNGKIDRKSLPAPVASRGQLTAKAYAAARTPFEEILVGLWAELLGLELVGIHDNFFELGGHSLLATQLISRVRDVLQLELPLRSLFEAPTPARLAARIAQVQTHTGAVESSAISPVARQGDLPLSFAQTRLWFLDQLMPGNPFYNMPLAWHLTGELDVLALERSLNQIIRRHETLHTSFGIVDGQPTQLIAASFEFTLATLDLVSLPEPQRWPEVRQLFNNEAQQPFDLSVAPLLRVKLLRLAPTEHVLLLTMHHIISDGWSIGVFNQELAVLYEALVTGQPSPLPELTIQYADFALWQRTWLEQPAQTAQRQYWQQQLANLPPLELLTDFPRPAIPSFAGGRESLALSEHLKQGLVKLSLQHGVTLFMTMLAAFKVLLHRYTGQTDIVVGSAIANRNRSEIESLIGFFVNTLVLRTNLEGNPSYSELLARVREVTLGAYAHQDWPFEQLVEELQPERQLNQNPLVQVMFAVQNAPMEDLQLPGLQLSQTIELEQHTTRFDLEWHVWKQGKGLQVEVFYARDLFAPQTIERMLGHFQTLLEAIVSHPDERVQQLPLLQASEQQQLLINRNQTEAQYPQELCIHQLFESQVERTPDAVAVVFEGSQLTYRQLNAQSNQLAAYLQSLGVGPEVLVGICVERSPSIIVGLLGILKAGGAYVPIDPEYPSERKAFMIEDSGVRVLLTQARLIESFPQHQAHVVCLDTQWAAIADHCSENPISESISDRLAYVMYTSGSTGKPKGVAVPHRAVNRLVINTNYINLEPLDVVAQVSNCSFDAATFEIWGALLNGARLVVITKDVALSPQDFAAQLHALGITVLFLTTALFNQIASVVPSAFHSVQHLLFGGEAVEPRWVKQVLKNGPPQRLLHVYGPTESTTFTTWYLIQDISQGNTTIPIGRPIANTQIYLLDEKLQPLPIGVPGELYIGGDGLAKGYLNRPDLTDEKFIPNPWSNKLGSRLYKTGDQARYLSDGNIEFLGRIDNQVKIRGFRIELGEIEAVLNQHPLVQQAVATVQQDSLGHQRLVAYYTQHSDNSGNATIESHVESTQLPSEHISHWQTLYEQTYAQSSQETNPTFNIVGWNSSYTNQPIPAEQMQQWLNGRVNHLLAFQPQRVLEIGCGTGLLLFQIAPHCLHYCGTDFSDVALTSINRQLCQPGWQLPQVELQQKLADDFNGILPASFDTVILNSVVQYFPSIDYLLQVLTGAVKAVASGGIVFVGDVRSLPMLEAFHASVQLYQAEDELSIEKLRQRVQAQMAQETELAISPEFFLALKQHLPQISQVQIRLQRGEYHNELTCFRYDVTLHIGQTQPIPYSESSWHDGKEEELTLAAIAQLFQSQPEQLGIANIPNARVLSALKTVELLSSPECSPSISQMQAAIESVTREYGVEPEQLWNMAQQQGYTLAISWSPADLRYYDALFWRHSTQTPQVPVGGATPLERKTVQPRAWSSYANNPLNSKIHRQLQSQLRAYLQESLPEYMVPSALVMLAHMPLTPNGKIDRKSLPTLEASRGQFTAKAYAAPRTPVEEILVGLWAEILGVEYVGIHDNFFELGGHSLLATQLISRVRDVLQLELPLRSLFEAPNPVLLAAKIAQVQSQGGAVETPALEAVERNGDLPLSFAQARLWFLDQLMPGNSFHNMPWAWHLSGELDVPALERSFHEIIRRHETLRTSFQMVDGQPRQLIASLWELKIDMIDLLYVPGQQRQQQMRQLINTEAWQPFDLSVAPLLRVKLLRLAPTEHVLLLTMHHIISDGWSMGVLNQELAVIYAAFVSGQPSPLPELSIQYADFTVWQRRWLEQPAQIAQKQYWQQQLANLSPLQLPTDYPRPAMPSFAGGRASVEISESLKQGLVKLSLQHGVTLFMTMLLAFKVLLHRYTGQTDIVVGSSIANRNRSEIESLIGFFVNTLVLRTKVEDNPSYSELLTQVREVTLGAYAHQDCPFEQLVEELQPERHLNQNPLVQVMFTVQNAPMEDLQLQGLQLSQTIELEENTTRFDLEWHVWKQGKGLQVEVLYATDLFAPQTIERMLGHFQTLLEGIVSNPQQRVQQLPLLPTSEQQQLLINWNQTDTQYPRDLCIHQLFESQVERTPDAVAVVFEGQQLTYRQLNAQSNQLAAYLQSLGVGPEVLVGICVERSLSMIVGLLSILKAGGAYVPLDPAYPQERLAYTLSDARVRVLLTQQRLMDSLPQTDARVVCLDLDNEEVAQHSCENPTPGVMPTNQAYVIYTSGSTGRPKGVVIEHHSVVALLAWAKEIFTFEDLAGVLASTSICFDLSVFELFVPLSWGGKVILAENALSLLTLPAALEVTLINTVPSAIAELARSQSIPASVRTVNLAGEPLQNQLVQRIYQLPNVQQVFNLYGPSEDTTYSTFALVKKGDSIVTIGRPIANTQVYLLDAQLQPVPIGVPGELYIGGEGLARGYLNRPELTPERFVPHPFSNNSGERLYKSGDKARYLPDGNIEFLGRIDHQVKLRGLRIELGEIEAVLNEHPLVQQAVATVREDRPGHQQLVAYYTQHSGDSGNTTLNPLNSQVRRQLQLQLRSHLEARLPEYMVPSALVMLTDLPLTPNGKLDRKSLPAPVASRGQFTAKAYAAARTPFEEILVGLWAEILGLELVGIHDNFFELGGHSLLATQLISRVRDVLQLELPLRSLFEAPTPARLAERIAQVQSHSDAVESLAISPVARQGDLPLSFAQARLWFLDQLVPGNPFYNMPLAWHLTGELDVLALERSLNQIIRRHETLHTSFGSVDGQPTQLIAPALELTLAMIDLRCLPQHQRSNEVQKLTNAEAQQPFDLTVAPLLRVKLLRLAPTEHVLLLTMHHIISDGWSIGVFNQELAVLYEAFVTGQASPLPELPIQYADFALWQRTWLEQPAQTAQRQYWQQQLANLPPLVLPTDFPRPAIQSFAGGRETLALSENLKQALVKLSLQHGVTLFMTMLAAFKVLLHRYTGQTDIVVGSAIANRNRSEIESLIGFFVNTLVLRTNLEGNPSYSELLARVREVTLGAYAHQDWPFEQLVEELQPERHLSLNPLVQVMFAVQNAPMDDLQLQGIGLQLSPITQLEVHTTRFDLEWHVWRSAQGLQVEVFYARDLFAPQTIERMLGHFQTLLEGIVANPQQRVQQLPLLQATEQQQLLVNSNQTDTQYPHDQCIHQLFELQVERNPEAVAVVFEGQQLTYRQLNAQSNQLAAYLQSLGVGPEVLVGICVERSPSMIVGLLAILKAGGAYVPLDPTYPSERLRYMLEDAGVQVLLTQARLVQSLPKHNAQVVCLDTDERTIALLSESNPISRVIPDNLAYVIYTSGSTGLPKGVLVNHSNIVRLFEATSEWFHFDEQDVWTLFHSYAFDFSVWELWGALIYGGRIVVVPYLVSREPEVFYELLVSEKVTILNQTPSAFQQLIKAEESKGIAPDLKLRLVIFGGEALELKSLKPWFERHGERTPQLVNMYGITETTVHVTYSPLTIADTNAKASLIGRTIPDLQVYLLDQHQQLVPIGVPGEMYIGGAGLARGYLNRPDLTAERFVLNPFSNKPGTRLYKTGDRSRYLSDGNIEFLGRIDHQVKIRGFRIELEEIESLLTAHPAVRQSVVLAREDVPGDKRLVAYIAPHSQKSPSEEHTLEAKLQVSQVLQWQMLYNDTYSKVGVELDPTFNIAGWNSSYTREPIPAEQMREWVNDKVQAIVEKQPSRVLEIGCGTGLLLFQIAPHTSQYWGTDFSPVAVDYIQQQLTLPEQKLPQVSLLQRMADDFEGIEAQAFDAVILSSIVQYFPNIDYLMRVLEGAVQVVAPGGFVFVGDVRSLPLLEAFHASVELHQAPGELSVAQLQSRVQRQLLQENELVIDPAFFIALGQRFPNITHVQIQLQRGHHHNELTKFRYNVILHVGADADPTYDFPWMDWHKQQLTLSGVRQLLLESAPERLGITRIPNARLLTDLKTVELLKNPEELQTVEQLRSVLKTIPLSTAVEPEDLWSLAETLSYSLVVSWLDVGDSGHYDVVFVHSPPSEAAPVRVLTPLTRLTHGKRPWRLYGNNPLQSKLNSELVPQLRTYLNSRLPDYMVPSDYVLLESFPLTPNGKVDRRALKAPDRELSRDANLVAPRTPTEEAIALIWAQLLGLKLVGIHDNFFELGGHSLVATQIISRLRQTFKLELPLRYMFEQPTVAELAQSIERICSTLPQLQRTSNHLLDNREEIEL